MSGLGALMDVERWGKPIEREVRRRMHVAVATYAYEVADAPIMTDRQWDELAQNINARMGTCHPLLDEFFASQFSPMTGLWIHQHPELGKVKAEFERFGPALKELYGS